MNRIVETTTMTMPATAASAALLQPPAPPTLWTPERVLVTRSASELPHGADIVARCEAAGVADIDVLTGDRLPPLRAENDRATYALAKRTLAVVVAPPSKLRLQPIPPSADWRVDLAEGCPAHCQYCYLAGSLSGPPITRVYANLPEILADMDEHVGQRHHHLRLGRARRRGHDVRGVLLHRSAGARAPDRFAVDDDRPRRHPRLAGAGRAAVHHQVRRCRAAARSAARRPHPGAVLGQRRRGRPSFRGWHRAPAATHRGAASAGARGYRVGLTIAPIMPIPDWRDGYGALLRDVAPRSPTCPTSTSPSSASPTGSPREQRRPARLVSAHQAGDGRVGPHPQVRQVRFGQVRLPQGRRWPSCGRGSRPSSPRRCPQPACCTGRD